MAERDVGVGLVEKVVFVGAESTGKTTLAAYLAREFDTVFVPEIGRFIWEEKQGRLTAADYVDIAVKHRQAEAERRTAGSRASCLARKARAPRRGRRSAWPLRARGRTAANRNRSRPPGLRANEMRRQGQADRRQSRVCAWLQSVEAVSRLDRWPASSPPLDDRTGGM